MARRSVRPSAFLRSLDLDFGNARTEHFALPSLAAVGRRRSRAPCKFAAAGLGAKRRAGKVPAAHPSQRAWFLTHRSEIHSRSSSLIPIASSTPSKTAKEVFGKGDRLCLGFNTRGGRWQCLRPSLGSHARTGLGSQDFHLARGPG